MSEFKYHPEAQQEIKEALISFLWDCRAIHQDSSAMMDNGTIVRYSKKGMQDALVVIMNAFGFQVTDNGSM